MKPFLHPREWLILTVALGLLGLVVVFRVSRNRSPITDLLPPAGAIPERNAHIASRPFETMDTNQLITMTARWMAAAGVDPFGRPLVSPTAKVSTDPFAGLDQLQVTAVWRQPGRQLAVINGQIVEVGESVGRFRLEQCDADGVWLTLPNASRRLKMPRIERLPAATARAIAHQKDRPTISFSP